MPMARAAAQYLRSTLNEDGTESVRTDLVDESYDDSEYYIVCGKLSKGEFKFQAAVGDEDYQSQEDYQCKAFSPCERNILVCSGFFACFEICQVLFVLFGCVALVRVFPDLSSVQQHAYQSDGGQDQENYESVSYPRKQRQTYDLLGNTGGEHVHHTARQIRLWLRT